MPLPPAPQPTSPSFAYSTFHRAILEGLAKQDFGSSKREQAFRFFNDQGEPGCVYCGSLNAQRWDHLVPIAQGGDTVLGNMVLACARCDSSKGASDFKEWMFGRAARSPTTLGVVDVADRVGKIEDYVRHYKYKVQDHRQKLNGSEREQLINIEKHLDESKQCLVELIASYDARTRKV